MFSRLFSNFDDYFNGLDTKISDLDFNLDGCRRSSTFKYETSSTTEGLQFIIELPGVKKENLKLEHDGNFLTILFSKNNKNYKQQFDVSSRFNVDATQAKLELGILTILVPRYEGVKKGKQIEIT